MALYSAHAAGQPHDLTHTTALSACALGAGRGRGHSLACAVGARGVSWRGNALCGARTAPDGGAISSAAPAVHKKPAVEKKPRVTREVVSAKARVGRLLAATSALQANDLHRYGTPAQREQSWLS